MDLIQIVNVNGKWQVSTVMNGTDIVGTFDNVVDATEFIKQLVAK